MTVSSVFKKWTVYFFYQIKPDTVILVFKNRKDMKKSIKTTKDEAKILTKMHKNNMENGSANWKQWAKSDYCIVLVSDLQQQTP